MPARPATAVPEGQRDAARTRCAGGRAAGVFRRDDVDAVDVHTMISASCVFRVPNRHTFGTPFKRDLTAPELRDHDRRMLGDMVVEYLSAERGPAVP
jgi:hypothetical protein